MEGDGPMPGSETENRTNELFDASIEDIDWKQQYDALLAERNALILERDILSKQCYVLLSRRDELERELQNADAELERVSTESSRPIGQGWSGIVARFPRVLRRRA